MPGLERMPSIHEVKGKARLVIFGPYEPEEAKSFLIDLKRCLTREEKYLLTNLVEDFPRPLRKAGEDFDEYIVRKSYDYLEYADIRIFVFLENAKNDGVTMELKHMLDNLKDKVEHSVVCAENGRLSRLISGEIKLSKKLYRIDFDDQKDLKEKLRGLLLNFLKQLYYEIQERDSQ